MTYFSDELRKKLIDKKYKESSIKAFETNIKRLIKLIDPDGQHDRLSQEQLDMLDRSSVIIAKIDKYIDKLNVKTAMFNAVVKILEADGKSSSIIEPYQQNFSALSRYNVVKNQYLAPSKSELENFTDMNGVRSIQKKWEGKVASFSDRSYSDITNSQRKTYLKYLLCSLYTFFPPLRGEEYYKTMITYVDDPDLIFKEVKGSDEAVKQHEKKYDEKVKEIYEEHYDLIESNFYDVRNHMLYIKNYKTEKKYGARVLKFPEVLHPILERWSALNNSTFLIPNLDGNSQMSQQGFTSLMNSIFKPYKISSSMMRKIFISDFLASKPSADLRKKVANQMAHALDTQEFIYKRFVDKEQKGGNRDDELTEEQSIDTKSGKEVGSSVIPDDDDELPEEYY